MTFQKAKRVEGEWERGYSAARDHFASAIKETLTHVAAAEVKIDRLRAALHQIRARANSLQNADSHSECMRQFACIDHIAKGVGIELGSINNEQQASDDR